MKKLTTFALIILALFSGVLFSACGDKYKKLSMSVVYTDGQAVEELVLIKDSNKPELATKRIGIKFSGIDEEDIGQVAVYSNPSELFTTTNANYNGNYYYIDLTANKPATGDLIVKHLSSNKTTSVKLRIEQKSNDLTKRSEKYVVAVNGVNEGETRTHILNTKNLISLQPSTSTDRVCFKEVMGNRLPTGVTKIEETIDGVTYVTGFEISDSAVEQTDSFKLIPVTKMQGYDDKSYDDALHNDYEVVEIFFKNVLTNENVVLDTDEKHKDADENIYETMYLIANETRAEPGNKYNYNNVLFDLKTIDEAKFGVIANYLNDYTISINENSSAIQTSHIGNGRIVIQATTHTEEVEEVEIVLSPKHIVGDVETIVKKVKVKGEVRSDKILTKKDGQEIDIDNIDIYDYMAAGNPNGIKFNFEAVSNGGIAVYPDLAQMRIEIAPEILYLNAKDGVYTNIKTKNASGELVDVETRVSIIDGVNNRTLANQKKLIRIFKNNNYLNFVYDAENQVFVSDTFNDFSNIYIKYVENPSVAAGDGVDLKIDVTAGYEGEFNYLTSLSETDKKTRTTLNFEAKQGVKALNVYAASFEPGMGGTSYLSIGGEGSEIVAEDIHINRADEDIVWDEGVYKNGYALALLKDKSILGYDGYINDDGGEDGSVVFEVNIAYANTITNPISLTGVVDGKLTIDSLNQHLHLVVKPDTSVGKYVITFTYGNGFSKSINVYIYESFDVDEHLTLDFNAGQLDNYSFKNSYFDEGVKKYTYSDYVADYIVHSGKTLNLTANINKDILDSNIIESYSYTATENSNTLVVNNYFSYFKDLDSQQKTELNFLKGSVEKDSSTGDYVKYYISYNVEIKTKKFINILQENTEEKYVDTITLTFFIYDKIVENKQSKASLVHPTYDLFVYDYLGFNNKQFGQADLSVVMTDEKLWSYVQLQEGETNLVKWKDNINNVNILSYVNQDKSTKVTFKNNSNSNYYYCTISAELNQFGNFIELPWSVVVYKPTLTEELRLTNSKPTFKKLSSNTKVTNKIFEYDLDLREGDEFVVTADQISSIGEVSHKGLSLVVVDGSGNVHKGAVSIDGNKIVVDRIQAGLRLIVYAKDVLRADVSQFSAGFNLPEQYIMNSDGPSENDYMAAYFIINLHLEDGKTKETAYSVYSLSDFKQMLGEESGKFYRIMNDINLTGLDLFNVDFKGSIFSANNQNYILYDLKLTAENENLFNTFEGSIENITFETEYAYDSSTATGNLGIIGELATGSTLKYVKTIISGSTELANVNYNFGLLVGVNNGNIHYYETFNETKQKYEGRLATAVSGRLTLKGNSAIKFGGITGVNNGEIIGVNYNESALTTGTAGTITFATSEEQQGALVNINLIASELQFNANSAIGGIVGVNGGKLTNAYVTGNINAPNINNVGGAIGKSARTENGSYSRDTSNKISYINASTENKEIANVEHIKSSAIIIAKDNVGGIVGYDEYGLYRHCWYQILPTTNVGISANQYVGGIVGYSNHSKLQFCSVFSYKYDYVSEEDFIASLKSNGVIKQPDIVGNKFVGGLIGYVVSSNLETDTLVDIHTTIVRNSSVNAVIKAKDATNNNVGGIYATEDSSISGIIYSSYFIGKLTGTYGSQYLDNLNSSANNIVYALNVKADGTGFDSYIKGISNLEPEVADLPDWWNKYTDINLDYIYVSSDESANKPIFDLVPSSFDVVVTSDSSKTLNTYFYDFSTSGANENELKLLNEEFNQTNVLDLFTFTYAPGGNITAAVSSSNTNVVDIINGKLVVLGLGQATLKFYPVLNPNLVCEINVNVADNLSKVVVTEDGKTQLTQIGIEKGKTKQLHTYSVGTIDATRIVGLGKIYNYKSTRQYGLLFEVTWETGSRKISDYISVNNANIITDTETLLKVYLPYGTPLSFTSEEIGGSFNVKVTPCVREGVVYLTAQPTEFTLSTWRGVREISLNYNSAIVYPNDVTTLVSTITTDIELGTIAEAKALINSIYLFDGENTIEIEQTNFDNYLSVKVNRRDEDTSKQEIVFTIKFDSEFEKITKPYKLKINFKSAYTSSETVEYTILPQRIDKIETKSYIYSDFANAQIEQSEVLKPNNLGLLVIDIAPNNGYFDYLEIDDVTGNEEIKFTQLDGVNGNTLFDADIPSISGKGIRLAKLDKDDDDIADSIYVTMQIDKNYSSKMHTLRITAYYQENGVGTAIKTDYKYIDVKMLPIIQVEHQLPNGESVAIEEDRKDLYFANGTSSQFRITTLNTTEPLEYSCVTSAGVNGEFELVNTHGDFYTLRNSIYNENDCGGKITITLTAKSIIANNIETTTLVLEFTIVKYVIHSVSVTNSNAKGEIFGNIGVPNELEFYFKTTDISYYNNGSYHNTIYIYDSTMGEIAVGDSADVVTRKSINNILKELNTNAENYLIKNIGLSDNYTRPTGTTGNEIDKYVKTKTINGETYNIDNDNNISLTFIDDINKLVVYSGYNQDAHLALDMELKLDTTTNNWSVQSKIEDGTINLSKNYKLNFIRPYSEDDYMLIKNEEDFLAMKSGKQNYYILGNDLVLENYSPIDVEIAEFDGNGRTITIRSFAKFTEQNISAGLFKQIYSGMTIKNVNVVYQTKVVETIYSFGRVKTNSNTSKVKDFDIEYADLCNDISVNYTSAVFGGLTPINNGVITNCSVNGEIALRASIVEINKTATTGGNYEIAFNIGGLVGTNSKSGYITHSTSGLKIFALANIGGLVYDNQGKIASSSVEDEAVIYSYNNNLEKTILVEVGGFVSQNSGQISMSHTTLNYSYTPANTESGIPEHYKGFMSTKDESAGFVYLNKGDIKNSYVRILKIGDHSGTYCGFVYSNSGSIGNCYTSINQGIDAGASTYMFAQDGAQNLTNCIEFVNTGNGYIQNSSEGLKTLDYTDYIVNKTNDVKEEFIKYGFVFGTKNSAVWTIENKDLPVLVACEDKVRYTLNQTSTGNNYFGLRNFEYVEKPIKNQDGSTSFEMKVEFKEDSYGTKSNPFVIYNLANWENRFYNNTTAYYRIVADIEFSSLKNPSTSEFVFSGNIQGNDMILSNIKLYIQNDVEALGLFKTLQTADDFRIDNSIRNLTLKTTTAWASKADAFGVLGGKAVGFKLYNISIDSSDVVMVGGNAVGGVVGYLAGEFDVDGMMSNISVNSTRELSSYRYSIYAGRNNKLESNLTSVFYAGAVFGVVDGYDYADYDINDIKGRNLDIDKYYYINHVAVDGNPVLIGDTVGGAFGFVGERVYVKNVNINLSGAQFKGYQYSAGLAGENRGVIADSSVKIEGESFANANYAAAGVVGLNVGGLIKDVTAQVNIVRDNNISVGGIVARNVYGTINSVSFEGELMGQSTGAIMAANYSHTTIKDNNGAGSLANAENANLIIPTQSVEYKENNEEITFANLIISEQTLQYFIDNIHKFYIYQEKLTSIGGTTTKELIQQKSRAFGLFVAMTDLDDFASKINKFEYNSGVEIILNNSDTEAIDDRQYKNVGLDYDVTGYVKVGISYYLEDDGSIKTTNNNKEVKTIQITADYLYSIYITGAKVNTFDSWDKSAYTSDFVVFGNFNPPAAE